MELLLWNHRAIPYFVINNISPSLYYPGDSWIVLNIYRDFFKCYQHCFTSHHLLRRLSFLHGCPFRFINFTRLMVCRKIKFWEIASEGIILGGRRAERRLFSRPLNRGRLSTWEYSVSWGWGTGIIWKCQIIIFFWGDTPIYIRVCHVSRPLTQATPAHINLTPIFFVHLWILGRGGVVTMVSTRCLSKNKILNPTPSNTRPL